ncbi:hypothetical protein AB4K08_00970 [Serratia fonticola]|uniref:hypothetical protein n=1 Tax=Serratia fonticola TaxID=47917 RepID=UPI0034C6C128
MLMFKHFCDKPDWATAAGYHLTLVNCMSYAATDIHIINGLKNVLGDILDTEIREIPWRLSSALIAALLLSTWPLTFWLYGLLTYIRCLKARRKFLNSTNPMVIKNLSDWRENLERRWQRGKSA